MAPSSTSPTNISPQTTKDVSNAKHEENILWKLTSIPGKDFGLLATQDISPGTLLLSEAPILTTEDISLIDPVVAETQLKQKLNSVPKHLQTSFLSLHNNYPSESHTLTNIVRSNGYPLGPGSEIGGVFANISRINHSCLPNAVQAWNPVAEKETVYAVRAIPEGKEITTAYHVGGPSAERKAILKNYFTFDCTCELCSLPEKELRVSDARLKEAEELDARVGDSKLVHSSPGEVLKSCKRLSEIWEAEGIKDDRLSRLYFDAFQVCNMHGDLARARCFMKQYVSAKKMASGVDCLDVLEMKQYVKWPERHESYSAGGRWKTAKDEVLKGVGRKEFERWLWRED